MSHRFFASADGTLPREEAEHAIRVLRLQDGAPIEVLTESGEVYSAVLSVSGNEAKALDMELLPSREAPVDVTLYMGLPKGEKLELISQKLTELGVKRIVPVRMERCVAKIEAKEAEKKLQRPRRIASEAQKQSGRNDNLEITDPVDMGMLPKLIAGHDAAYLFWEEAHGYRLTDARNEHPGYRNIAYIVGPEGGITAQETEKLISAGATLATLGPRILRAETAAIAGAVEILTLWGDI